MKFNLRKLYKTVSLSFLIVASWVGIAHAATQDVRVTNFPTSYSVVNTTWDSRLSTLQSTLQSLAADMSQFPTFVSRFGWNGTISFSQGFELLYNDVHALASSTSNSDILAAFNREFYNSGSSQTVATKYLLQRVSNRLDGTTQTGPLWESKVSLSSIDTYTQHIDSDLHSIGNYVVSMDSTLDSIDGNTSSIYNLTNSNLPYIKVNTDNISVDTEHISDTQDTLVSQGAVTMRNVGILREFFADDDTLAQKASAKDASDSALNNFTGNGDSSASAQDYSDIDWAVSDLKVALGTGSVSALDATSVMTGVDQTGWAWFSQATYDSINPAPSRGGLLNVESYMAFYEEQLVSDTRKGSSDAPLLDGYYKDINKAVGK